MANDYLSNEFGDNFNSQSNSYKSAVVRQFLDQVVKRPDQTYEVLQRLAQGQSDDDVFSYFYINNPQEYNTLLSDINDFYAPEIFQQYVNKFPERENAINEIRSALSNPSSPNSSKILENISSEGEYLISKILKHTDNEAMRRNVYKLVFDNFQQFINLQQPDQFKEAKKGYNAPRTGKLKKRWSVKHKRGIDCNNVKGFSAKQYCKRKRRGGKYKTEG
jgi:polyribonucleotide nucleotidyltransferase